MFLRLREVLEFTISNEQAVFLKLRKTLDVILIDNEVVEYRRNNREALVSKIDFEKTYNHVDWNFLDFVLKGEGGGDRECG